MGTPKAKIPFAEFKRTMQKHFSTPIISANS